MEKSETPKKLDHADTDESSPYKDPAEECDKELSPIKDLSRKMLNNNKEECSPAYKDKDSVMGDEVPSDLESEGAQPEEVRYISTCFWVNAGFVFILAFLIFF